MAPNPSKQGPADVPARVANPTLYVRNIFAPVKTNAPDGLWILLLILKTVLIPISYVIVDIVPYTVERIL